jgi:serine/threonine protein kinase
VSRRRALGCARRIWANGGGPRASLSACLVLSWPLSPPLGLCHPLLPSFSLSDASSCPDIFSHLLSSACSQVELRFYAACLILALERLHALGVVYRDLKPENVLLHADGWPVLADLGLASFVLDERPLFSVCGTPEFMAPEVIQNRGYNTSADWWSLGILLTQCLTLTTPFQDPHGRPQKTFDNILVGRVTAPPGQQCRNLGSPHTVAFMDALLDRDAARRLGSSTRGTELKPHPFFWGLDWAAIQRRAVVPPHADYAAMRGRNAEAGFVGVPAMGPALDATPAEGAIELPDVPGW